MAQVITRCQRTGHYMYMGIDVAPERFTAWPDSLPRKFCPFCSCEHAWYKADSNLLDCRPASRQDVQRAL
jgi:hypothetical protein